jgi:hypothetical protein
MVTGHHEAAVNAVRAALEALPVGTSLWGYELTNAARAAVDAAAPHLAAAERGEEVTEHAQLMSGGGYHVRNGDPEIEKIYPLAEWIVHSQRFGGKVYRRVVIVVEDWTEVPNEAATLAAKLTALGVPPDQQPTYANAIRQDPRWRERLPAVTTREQLDHYTENGVVPDA